MQRVRATVCEGGLLQELSFQKSKNHSPHEREEQNLAKLSEFLVPRGS